MGADATSRLSVVNPAGDLAPTIVARHFGTGPAPRKPGKNKEGCLPASNVSRRSFVTAAAAALGASAIGAATTTAFAEESATSYTFADTVEWAAQYDVVVLGMGFSGLVSAMAAADEGASVLICEKAPQGEEGGTSMGAGRRRFCSHLLHRPRSRPRHPRRHARDSGQRRRFDGRHARRAVRHG